MLCTTCKKEIPDDFSFCCFCGAKQAVKCSVCGADLYAGAVFCGKCGTRVAEGIDVKESAETTESVTIEISDNLCVEETWLNKNVDLAREYNIDWVSDFCDNYAVAHIMSKEHATGYTRPNIDKYFSQFVLIKEQVCTWDESTTLEIVCSGDGEHRYTNCFDTKCKRFLLRFEIPTADTDVCTAFGKENTRANECTSWSKANLYILLNNEGGIILSDYIANPYGNEYVLVNEKWLFKYDNENYPYTYTLVDLSNNRTEFTKLPAFKEEYNCCTKETFYLFHTDEMTRKSDMQVSVVDTRNLYYNIICPNNKLLISKDNIAYRLESVFDENGNEISIIVKYTQCVPDVKYKIELLNAFGERMFTFSDVYNKDISMYIYKQYLYMNLKQTNIQDGAVISTTTCLYKFTMSDTGYTMVQNTKLHGEFEWQNMFYTCTMDRTYDNGHGFSCLQTEDNLYCVVAGENFDTYKVLLLDTELKVVDTTNIRDRKYCYYNEVIYAVDNHCKISNAITKELLFTLPAEYLFADVQSNLYVASYDCGVAHYEKVFYNGLAYNNTQYFVIKDKVHRNAKGYFGLIDSMGKVVIPPAEDNYAIVPYNNKYCSEIAGLLKVKQILPEEVYDSFAVLHNTEWCGKPDECTVIDYNGVVVIERRRASEVVAYVHV